MRIIAYGLPGSQGSKKHVGQGRMIETSPKLIPWRNTVCIAAEMELDRVGRPAPFAAPMQVTMVFTFLRPPSVKKAKRLYPSVSPDLSKIVRSTEDALTDAGVWTNDALVVVLSAWKVYAGEHLMSLDRAGVTIDVDPVIPLDVSPSLGGVPESWKVIND